MNGVGSSGAGVSRISRILLWVALLGVLPSLAALVLQSLLWRELQPLALFFFWPAIVVGSWRGDLWSGLVATLLSSVLSWYYFVPPERTFVIPELKDTFTIVTFTGIGVSMAVLGRLREIGRRHREENAKLKAAVQATDDFLAVAGHELRSPLAALLVQLEAAQRTVGRVPDAKALERIDGALSAGRELDQLITNLLDVSRITEGGLHLEPEPLDLSRVVEQTVGRLAEVSSPSKSPIVLTCEEHVNGHWDRLRIGQIVNNLVGNAVKYGQGKPVEVDLRARDGMAIVRVVDHGIGMTPEHLKKLFQKFERGLRTRGFHGFGLGLWITKRIVEASGGDIHVESAPDLGTTFTVRLPMAVKIRGGIAAKAETSVGCARRGPLRSSDGEP